MIYSFLKNNPWWSGDIRVLTDSLTNDAPFSSLNSHITVQRICPEEYREVIEHNKQTTSPSVLKAFYKFELFRDNDEYERIMWLDADTLIVSSIEELFTGNGEDNNTIMWVPDRCGGNEYFNTGVFIFNKKGSTNEIYNDLMNFSKTCKREDYKNPKTFRGTYADQDIFNERLKLFFTIKVAGNKYNQQGGQINNDTSIVHYLGGEKPWKYPDNKDDVFFKPWHEYMKMLNEEYPNIFDNL